MLISTASVFPLFCCCLIASILFWIAISNSSNVPRCGKRARLMLSCSIVTQGSWPRCGSCCATTGVISTMKHPKKRRNLSLISQLNLHRLHQNEFYNFLHYCLRRKFRAPYHLLLSFSR